MKCGLEVFSFSTWIYHSTFSFCKISNGRSVFSLVFESFLLSCCFKESLSFDFTINQRCWLLCILASIYLSLFCLVFFGCLEFVLCLSPEIRKILNYFFHYPFFFLFFLSVSYLHDSNDLLSIMSLPLFFICLLLFSFATIGDG